ncbi:MAG: hypothetical protein R3C05_28740 [Pirellulaceae bacterium]
MADHVHIEGTNSHDNFAVNGIARTVSVTDAAGTALQTLTLANDVEIATVLGRDGNDTFLVSPAPSVGALSQTVICW